MADYNPLVDLTVDRPADFGAMMYSRSLEKLTTYCAIHTPFRLDRTPELVRERPYDNLVVLVSTLRGHTTVQQGTRDFAYLPGQLVFVNFAVPYSHYCDSVTDPMGVIIPIDLLGRQRHTAERARRPVASHTLLSRAAAGFVTRFAVDTAISSAPAPPVDTELAAVDLITAALAELNFENYRLEDNALFVHEAAVDLIDRHHRDPDFSPDVIASELHLSRRQVYRNFERTGESVAGLIAARRAETARELLMLNPGLAVGDVAAAAGFPSVATFRNRFRAHYGMGPREFRKLAADGAVDLTVQDSGAQ
ncbi:Transcriptional activator NphR [Gordonia insulae]|uniref:Transcriptional activator NphR n=2 Tax=Gordonia insulae TaxID=2420509 RepID=A0A3G8JUR8_9ACTN|nr:Transcriptional activator NphR [Gordonia insulae]